MSAFEYVGVDADGKKQKGVLEADSARQVRQQLRDKGLVPVAVTPAARQPQAGERRRLFQPRPGLNAYELALVTRQLSTLIQAGLPVEEALRAVARQTPRPGTQALLMAVRSRVVEGYTLAQALGDYPQAFPELYRATVSAGEQSGHLDLVLSQLADYTESRYDTQKKVQHALIYPVVLVVLCALIVTGLLTFVVPKIVKVFEDSHQALPVLTQGMIALSAFVRGWGWLFAIAVGGAVYSFRRALQNNVATRKRWHAVQLRIPLISRLVIGSDAARFASTLSIMSKSGVPLVDALQIAAQVMANLVLRDAVLTAAIRVREGGSLGHALEQGGQFPPMMVQLIVSGERSGELEDMLGRASGMQERELTNLVTTLVSLFEPAMLLVMAGIVLLIVLAVMLPIINMNNLIQ